MSANFQDPDPKPAAFYSQAYYLESCAGAAEYAQTLGADLTRVRQDALEFARIREGDLVLDLGCGRGELVLAARRRGARVIGADFSRDALELSRRAWVHAGHPLPAPFVCMDARAPCLRPDSVDVILMTDLAEHLPQAILREVFRRCRELLKPGGRLIVHTSPTRNFIRFGQHVKRALYRLTGHPVPPRVTWETEYQWSGHCNIQSAASLSSALGDFPGARVLYRFTIPEGTIKRVLGLFGLEALLSPNLWAIALAPAHSSNASTGTAANRS